MCVKFSKLVMVGVRWFIEVTQRSILLVPAIMPERLAATSLTAAARAALPQGRSGRRDGHLRSNTFLTCAAFASTNSNSPSERMCQTGFQYTPAASITMCVQPSVPAARPTSTMPPGWPSCWHTGWVRGRFVPDEQTQEMRN